MSDNQLANRGPVQFNIGELLKTAWGLFTQNVGLLLGTFIIFVLILGAAGSFTWGLGQIVVTGPMSLGISVVVLRVTRSEQPDFGVLFSGFQRFLPAFLAGLVISIFTGIGFILCIIPGLFVWLIYTLTYFYMYDKNLDFWPAMEASRNAIMANIGQWILLGLTIIGINLLGALACGIGIFVTAPVTKLMLALAYEQVERGVQPSVESAQ